MVNGNDTFMGQTTLWVCSSGHVGEVAARQSKDSILTLFAIVLCLHLILVFFIKNFIDNVPF